MRLVPVFTLETNNQTNNECLPKFVQTDNASSSIKTANGGHLPDTVSASINNIRTAANLVSLLKESFNSVRLPLKTTFDNSVETLGDQS